MKIIGKTQYGFLISASGDELAKIQGKKYETGLNYEARPHIGQEIDVDEAWDHLAKFKEAASDIKNASDTLRAVAQLSDQCAAVYSTIEKPTE